MTTRNPTEALAVGDPVVEILARPSARARIVSEMFVAKITPTLIITDDDRKWTANRWPLLGGRNSGRRLASAHEPMALTLRAQALLRAASVQADNLASLDRSTPEQVAADLAIVARAVAEAHREVLGMMRVASRASQSSER